MRALRLLIIGVMGLCSFSSGLSAQSNDLPPSAMEFTCPLGGATFKQEVAYPHFALVQFPDASHMGDEFVDAEIPECPDNTLLILPDFSAEPVNGEAIAYHAYTAEELERLPVLLADSQWKALLKHSRHQRAYWLATQLGRPASDRIQLLLRAQWATAPDPILHQQALEQLIRDLPGLLEEAKLDPMEAIATRFLRINALRELGRFNEARAELDGVRRSGIALLGPADPDAMFGPGDYGDRMSNVLDAGDDDRFAVDLLPDSFVGRVCTGEGFANYRGRHAAAACAARKKRRDEFDAAFARAEALRKDMPALERRCSSTPIQDDDRALAMACSRLVHERDWATGQQLAEGDPVKLAELCEATSYEQRSTIETSACSSYDTYKGFVVEALLINLDEKTYSAVCINERRTDMGFEFGCNAAYGSRANAAARALLKDRQSLEQSCADKQLGKPYSLQMACQELTADAPSFWTTQETPKAGNDPIALAALPYVETAIRRAMSAPDQ